MTAWHPTVVALLPELVLCAAAVVVLLAGMGGGAGRRHVAPVLTALALIAALVVTVWQRQSAGAAFASLNVDSLTWYVRLLSGSVGLLILLANWHVPSDGERAEYFSLLLFSLAGISLVSAADDLLMLFLALELVSVPTYVLIGLSRTHAQVQEATAKYFFLGAFAAAMTLYGFSFLYGAAGTTTLVGVAPDEPSLAAFMARPGMSGDALVRIGMLLALAGLAFKIAAVPFHFYVPDVYQGAAAPVSGMLGFVPKLAGFVALIRVLGLTGWQFDPPLFWLIWAMAAATMFAGNTLALMQRENVKRVLAYSSIAHTGYMLIALLAGPGGAAEPSAASPFRNGLAAVLFYIAIYGVMNLGAFAALAYFRRRSDGEPVETFAELSEAARSRPGPAIALAVCAVGLMGLPPTAGLIGKVYLFSSALSLPDGAAFQRPMVVLVVLGVINAAIAAAYYLRIASACLIGEKHRDAAPPTPCPALRAGLLACAVIVILAFVRPGPLLREAHRAADGLHTFSAQTPAPVTDSSLAHAASTE